MQKQPDYHRLYNSMLEAFDAVKLNYLAIEIVHDETGKAVDIVYLEVSPTTQLLIGKSREQIIGKSRKQLFGNLYDEFPSKFDQVARSSKPAHFEGYGAALNKYYDVYAWKVGQNQVAVIVTDITDHKKAEEALKESTSWLESVIASMNDPILIYDSSGNVSGFNQAFMRYYNFKIKKEVPKAIDAFKKSVKGYYLDGKPVSFEQWPSSKALRGESGSEDFIIERTDIDEKRIVNYSYAPVRGGDGQIIGAVLALKDITQSKKTEQELIEQKEKAQNYLNIVGNIVLALDTQSRITLLNRKAYEILGYKEGELEGKDWVETCLPPESRDELNKVFKDWVQGTTKTPTDYENPIMTKSGERRIISWHNSEIRDKKGNLIGTLSSGEDSTERKKAETQLDKYAKNLERLVEERTKSLKDSERLAAIGATAGMVGHDIRNPLQAITSDLYLAKSELGELPKSQQKNNVIESLDEIEKNIDYINKIVVDLQDYARPLNPRVQESDIKSLVEETLAKQKLPPHFTVDIEVEEEAQKTKVDPDYIKRIVYNLVLNAVQAMPEGGKLTVRVFKDKETGDVLLTIEDTGAGIPDEAKGKLFTPMFTTKSKGQGFGLAVVKRMTETLGGTVNFESEVGKGTKFTVRLSPQRDKR